MRDIPNYEGKYAITEDGQVWSYKHKMFMKQHQLDNGYMFVCLSRHSKLKQFLIHRLVAMTYLDNPNNLPWVNHKDENKQNNNVTNLEWCTPRYNNNYGTSVKRRSKPVYCVELDKVFPSIADAYRATGSSNIVSACKGQLKTAGGYHWQYAEDVL